MQGGMRVLVGCERSGVVRRAFRALGHDAWSCDLEPADDCSAFHLQCNVLHVLRDDWDMAIFHPDCTFTANSSSKHLWRGMLRENGPDFGRFANMVTACDFLLECWKAPIERVAIEQPVIHGHAQLIIKIPTTQIIHPWQFGHREMKETHLRLRGLPELEHTDVVGPPPEDPKERREWQKCWRKPPGPNRKKERSETYQGIAKAMAEQWGALEGQVRAA